MSITDTIPRLRPRLRRAADLTVEFRIGREAYVPRHAAPDYEPAPVDDPVTSDADLTVELRPAVPQRGLLARVLEWRQA